MTENIIILICCGIRRYKKFPKLHLKLVVNRQINISFADSTMLLTEIFSFRSQFLYKEALIGECK
jgi:hypothetical protein